MKENYRCNIWSLLFSISVVQQIHITSSFCLKKEIVLIKLCVLLFACYLCIFCNILCVRLKVHCLSLTISGHDFHEILLLFFRIPRLVVQNKYFLSPVVSTNVWCLPYIFSGIQLYLYFLLYSLMRWRTRMSWFCLNWIPHWQKSAAQ